MDVEVVRPGSGEEVAEVLTAVGREPTRGPIEVVGGGAHRSVARRVAPARMRLETLGLDRVVDYAPADLTVTVEAGHDADALARKLADQGQCWPQAAIAPGSTVGGILAAAASGRRRLREGPVRDSLLEVVVATGAGRLVRGGGRTVKNVSGFDIPRLMVGAHGTLGVIVQATLKLWPLPEHAAWFHRVGRPSRLLDAARALVASPARPAAVLMGPSGLDVELVGPSDDVVAPDGFSPRSAGPEPLAADAVMAVGVPPARLGVLVAALEEDGWEFRAQMGVGTCTVAVANDAQAGAVREHARALGGHAVLHRDTLGLTIDPWGMTPAGLTQMRRLRTAFDPAGILNPGRLVDPPGGAPA